MSANGPVLELRIALTVKDFEKTMAFYRDGLGLPLVREFGGEKGAKGAILGAGVATIEIVTQEAADEIDAAEIGRPTGGTIRLAMEVADSVATAERLAAAGGEIAGGPVTTPWQHRNVRLASPDGMQITLFTVLPERPPQPLPPK